MHLNALHMYNIELLKSPKSELIYETCTVHDKEITSFPYYIGILTSTVSENCSMPITAICQPPDV